MPNKEIDMSLTNEIKISRCYGCGAILQSDNPMEVGYIPKDKRNESNQLCERCYKLRHYGEVKEHSPSFDDSYIKLFNDATSKGSLLIYVIDAFSVNSSILTDIHPYLKSNVLVVINKEDVLPRDFNEEKLKSRVKAILHEDGIEPVDIVLISQAKNINMDEFMLKIDQYRKGKDVYFIGANNVGKSSIINNILKNYKNKTERLITTSKYPGTTLGLIGIPLDEESYMYDTPGIYNPKSVISSIDKKVLKYIIPREQINPRHYQIEENNSLIIGNLARLDFIDKPKTVKEKKINFTLFLSNDVTVERCKLSKADNTFISLILQNKTKPLAKTIKETKDLEAHEFILPETAEGTISIVISGLGYIMTQGKGQTIVVYAPKNVEVKVEHIDYRA